jgi:membrane protease YdiL (CAAX protease family)
VISIFATFAFAFTQSSITWSRIVEDTGGSWLGVVATALSAGVPEEFSRFVWQTRVGALFGNRAAGWLVATCVWAVLHGPKVWGDTHSMPAVVLSVLNIIPLGLLWGHITHRTRSILPSILIHATNVWGLQNLP